MKELADISLFNQLQDNANNAQLTDMVVFNVMDNDWAFDLLNTYWLARKRDYPKRLPISEVRSLAQFMAECWRTCNRNCFPATTDEANKTLKEDFKDFKLYTYRKLRANRLPVKDRTFLNALFRDLPGYLKDAVERVVLEDNMVKKLNADNFADIQTWPNPKGVDELTQIAISCNSTYAAPLADMIYKDFCQRNAKVTGVDERLLSFEMEKPAIGRFIKDLCFANHWAKWVPLCSIDALEMVKEKIKKEAGGTGQ